MKKIKLLIVSAFMVLGIGMALVPQAASAINVFPACTGSTNTDSEVCQAKADNADSLVKTLVNTLLYIVGALAVIMIIVGGIMYVISNGDQNNIERAKSIVTYAVVGLVVSFVSYAIVNWVLQIF